MYPALLPLMRTPRLPVVDWTDAPADLNGLVRFDERLNPVSALCAITFQLASNKNTHWMCTAMDPRLSYTRTHIEWGGFWNNNRQGYVFGTVWVEHSLTHSQAGTPCTVPVQHEWTKGQSKPPLQSKYSVTPLCYLLFYDLSLDLFTLLNSC